MSEHKTEPQDCPECGNGYLATRTDIYKDGRAFVYCDTCGCLADRRVWNRIAPRAALPQAVSAEPQWIPVSERIPKEEDGTVAVLTSDGAILTAWATYWHGASNAFNSWSFPHPDDDDSEVTHWMPLPAPKEQP